MVVEWELRPSHPAMHTSRTSVSGSPLIAYPIGAPGRPRSGSRFRMTIWTVCLFLLCGCAGSRFTNARHAFFIDGDPNAAVQILEQGGQNGLSALLAHMEKGLLLNNAGRFSESIAELRQASDLIDLQAYLSVSQLTASLLINDWMTAYKGEYCERLWVHTYLMIDYLMVRRYEDALVEAKQALAVIDTYPEALSEAYFSLALIGLCYELLGEFNDAYIVYERLFKQMPDPAPIQEERLRMGRLAGIDPIGDHTANPPASGSVQPPFAAAGGELILLVGIGSGPVKVASDIVLPPGIRISFPRYDNRGGITGDAGVYAGDRPLTVKRVSTDLNRVARISLGARSKRIIAKEAARVFAKEAIAQQVEQEYDAFVSFMTRLILMATEEADTRSWQTLPARHSLLRLPLEPGSHRLAVTIEGDATRHRIDLPPFTIHAGQRLFFVVRATDRFVGVFGQGSADSQGGDLPN